MIRLPRLDSLESRRFLSAVAGDLDPSTPDSPPAADVPATSQPLDGIPRKVMYSTPTANGKTVLLVYQYETNDYALVREDASGLDDPTFGTNGRVALPQPYADDADAALSTETDVNTDFSALVADAGGNLFVAGIRSTTLYRVTRAPDGTDDFDDARDTSRAFAIRFDPNGQPLGDLQPEGVNLPSPMTIASAIPTPDGRCTLVLSADDGWNRDNSFITIARLAPDGAADPTFGTHGMNTLKLFEYSPYDSPIDRVDVNPGGSVLISGTAELSVTTSPATPSGDDTASPDDLPLLLFTRSRTTFAIALTPDGLIDRTRGQQGLSIAPPTTTTWIAPGLESTGGYAFSNTFFLIPPVQSSHRPPTPTPHAAPAPGPRNSTPTLTFSAKPIPWPDTPQPTNDLFAPDSLLTPQPSLFA